MNEKLEYVLSMYPKATCELNYFDTFSLLIAVVLSAQTTDIKVNKVTKPLFEKYPDVNSLASASLSDVEKILIPLGMQYQKSKRIIEIAKIIKEKYQGVVPKDKEELLTLPGVGNKTANVLLAEGFKIPAFPVDTHINRIAKRLKLANIDDSVEEVEEKLKQEIPENLWVQMHHSLIFFGRYFCKAVNPNCLNCKYQNNCQKQYRK